MPQFRIVVEESTTEQRFKIITAPDLQTAKEQAEGEDWRTWELWAEPNTSSEIRDDQCDFAP